MRLPKFFRRRDLRLLTLTALRRRTNVVASGIAVGPYMLMVARVEGRRVVEGKAKPSEDSQQLLAVV